MKALFTILFAIGMTAIGSTDVAAMSKSRVRTEARFLTDKMAYELNLNMGQRNDAYEINYDFIYSVRDLMDDVLRGDEWATNRYYYLLDLRNDDLHWIMSDSQFYRFMMADYFYRPIYASGNSWSFRVYMNYSNRNFFYFDRPYHYTTYVFRNHRHNHSTPSFYKGRYNHTVYSRPISVRNNNVYDNNRRSDFNSVRVSSGAGTSSRVSGNNTNSRPNTNYSSRPSTSSSERAPAVNNSENRNSTTTAPSRNDNSNSSRSNSNSNSSSSRTRSSSSSVSSRSSSNSNSSTRSSIGSRSDSGSGSSSSRSSSSGRSVSR